jgi:predicted Zn finger-like uncharacterized protein
MALATRCPHCHTTFRVANDQLKLRAGLVRCGACKEVFNGIEHLLPPEAPDQSPAAAQSTGTFPVPDVSSEQPARDIAEPDGKTRDLASFLSPRPSPQPDLPGPTETNPEGTRASSPSENAGLAGTAPEHDPMLRMTLMDFRYAEDDPARNSQRAETPKAADGPDALDQAMDALQRKPWRDARKAGHGEADQSDEAFDEGLADSDEPSFVRQGRRRERMGRTLRTAMIAGSAVLLAGLLLQSAYLFRDTIVARLPQLKPALAGMCAIAGCELRLPAQIDAVSLDSSELQTVASDKNVFALSFLLRNRSDTAQSWPNIELTLNDSNEKPIARRVFVPRDYLGSQPESAGLPGKTEQSFKMHFELAEIKAAGYRVYLFYP